MFKYGDHVYTVAYGGTWGRHFVTNVYNNVVEDIKISWIWISYAWLCDVQMTSLFLCMPPSYTGDVTVLVVANDVTIYIFASEV